MLKQEIIEKITKYFKLTHYEAEKIYDDIFQSIMKGVKDDNITNVTNLGEFIVKYDENENSAYKKTVEFLPSSNLEDEIGGSTEFSQSAVTGDILQEKQTEIKDEEVKPEIQDTKPVTPQEKTKEIKQGQIEEKPQVTDIPQKKTEEEHPSSLSVEEEILRKREEIIHKLDPEHQEKYQPLLHVSEGINLNVPKPIVLKDSEINTKAPEKEIPEVKNEVKDEKPEIKQEKPEEIKQVKEEIKDDISKEKKDVEEITTKSFSDYFTEVKEEQKRQTPPEPVIPPVAVDLHKEIVGDKNITPPPPPPPYKTVETAPQLEMQTGNGYSTDVENKTNDNSYYIWYKDSEPNAIDTQTMSYEYELLYQATKEAEYKSKLRIYVTTFILFFSIVLILLIFSPVFYKYFFTPSEDQSNEQVQPEEQSTTTPENNDVTTVTPPVQNTPPKQENNTSVTPSTNNTVEKQQTTPQEQNKNSTQQSEQKSTNTPPVTNEQKTQSEPPATQQQNNNTPPKVEGVVKTGIGWIDEKNKVIYIQLDNGKYTIQESAWDSNDKANKRVTSVAAYNIAGLSGNVVKVDLGEKGIWFRARFGEFSTMAEAKQKAEELRNKEKIKLQALLMSILLFA